MVLKTFLLATNILLSNIKTRLRHPYKLTFSVTNKCNLRCKMCNIWKIKSSSELSLSEIETIFRKYNKFNWIDITGGEIFLRDDIEEIFQIITFYSKNLYLLHFPTNGTLGEKILRNVRRLSRKNIPKIVITVSLDGFPALHDRIRGVKGTYQKALNTWRRLSAIKSIEAFMGLTLSEYNLTQMNRIEHWFTHELRIPFSRVHINFFNQSRHFFNNAEMNCAFDATILSIADYLWQKRRTEKFSPINTLEKRYLKLWHEFFKTRRTPLPCHALISSCFIDAAGSVYPCTIFTERIGNLRDHKYDIREIWRSKNAEHISRKIREGKCPQCWTPCEAYQSILGNWLPFSRHA